MQKQKQICGLGRMVSSVAEAPGARGHSGGTVEQVVG